MNAVIDQIDYAVLKHRFFSPDSINIGQIKNQNVNFTTFHVKYISLMEVRP